MRRSSWMLARPLLAGLLLAGCAGAPLGERIELGASQPRVSPSDFAAFAAAPAVEIHGDRPGGASDAEIAAALRMPGQFRAAPFVVLQPGPDAQRRSRIVIEFGGASAPNAVAMCAGRVGSGGGARGLTAVAAFCRGATPGQAARLVRAEPAAPGDPAFQPAMTRLFAELAPQRRQIESRLQD